MGVWGSCQFCWNLVFQLTDPLIQAVSGRLVSSPQAQSTQLNRVTYQNFIHLGLRIKTHVGNTYPYHEPPKNSGAPTGALRETFSIGAARIGEKNLPILGQKNFTML